MRKITYCLLIISIISTGCNKNNNDFIARIGTSVLTIQDLNFTKTENTDPEQRNRFIDGWIKRELLFNEAISSGYNEDRFIKKEIERIRKELIIEKFLNETIDEKIDVTDSEIKEYYDNNIESFLYPETLYRIIIIQTQIAATRNKIREKIKGNNDLSIILTDSTISPRIVERGYNFVKESIIPRGILSRTKQLKESDIISGTKISNTYYFVQLLSKREEGKPAPLQEVYDEIKQQMYIVQKKSMYENLISTLRSREFIEINLPAADSLTTASDI